MGEPNDMVSISRDEYESLLERISAIEESSKSKHRQPSEETAKRNRRHYVCEKFAEEVIGGGVLEIDGMYSAQVVGAMAMWCATNGIPLDDVRMAESAFPWKGCSDKLTNIVTKQYGYRTRDGVSSTIFEKTTDA